MISVMFLDQFHRWCIEHQVTVLYLKFIIIRVYLHESNHVNIRSCDFIWLLSREKLCYSVSSRQSTIRIEQTTSVRGISQFQHRPTSVDTIFRMKNSSSLGPHSVGTSTSVTISVHIFRVARVTLFKSKPRFSKTKFTIKTYTCR